MPNYEELLVPLYPFVLSKARAMLKEEHEICPEDLVQMVYAKARKVWPPKKLDGLKGWLVTIARNEYINFLRGRRVRARAMTSYTLSERLEGSMRQTMFKSDVMSSKKVTLQDYLDDPGVLANQALGSACKALSGDRWEALCMYAVGGYSIQEIAYQQSTTIGTVCSRLSRAKGQIRKDLEYFVQGESF